MQRSRKIVASVAAALAVPLSLMGPGTAANAAVRVGSLTVAGPTANYGFPTYYEDSNGQRRELCWQGPNDIDGVVRATPLCAAAADTFPDPTAVASFPNNFPDESFYQLASVQQPDSLGQRWVVIGNLEAITAGGNSVFGRVRIRNSDAPAGTTYRVTHPYGVDTVTADAKGVFFTEDGGLVPGDFNAALSSRIGPFLRWDPAVAPAAPAGYAGDPGVDHAVVGSPYGTNFVKIERLNANGTFTTILNTNQFSLSARLARSTGVDVDSATYSVDPVSGQKSVEVLARTDNGKTVTLDADATLGLAQSTLGNTKDRYYTKANVTVSAIGKNVTVTNRSDNPTTAKTVKVTDKVEGAAYFNFVAHTLQVAATSSTGAALTVVGYGAPGTFTAINATALSVKVTSADGGSVTIPVSTSGLSSVPNSPIPDACPDITGNQAPGTLCTFDPVPDACPLVLGNQATGTDCVQIPVSDACPDIAGNQPVGSICTFVPVPDACPDIAGNQPVDSNCVITPVITDPIPDACPTITGNQAAGTVCIFDPITDACPTVAGNQAPGALCAFDAMTDACPTVAGNQAPGTLCAFDPMPDACPTVAGNQAPGTVCTFTPPPAVTCTAPQVNVNGACQDPTPPVVAPLTVTEAIYRKQPNKWEISGTGTAGSNVTLMMVHGSTLTVIKSNVTVGVDGKFVFQGVTTTVPKAGDYVRAVSGSTSSTDLVVDIQVK